MGTTTYDASAIQVLDGLEAVRKRPGMYIGSTGITGLHHCVWEVVDNSVDEAMAGHADRIEVTIHPDGACTVTDNGRGIPTGKHPQYKNKSAAEVVMTVLHAGGKFGGGGYKVSGGLHGVGVSVVNALSSKLVLVIDRDGHRWEQTFAPVQKGKRLIPGEPSGPLRKTGKSPRGRTGTSVTFWPDPTVFETVDFRATAILDRLRTTAYLNPGLTIVFTDQRDSAIEEQAHQEFRFDGGIADYVVHLNETRGTIHPEVGYFTAANDDPADPAEIEVAWQWTGTYNESLLTFANGISTPEGGTHAEGFRKALTQALNTYAKDKGLLKGKEPNLQGDDVREGLVAVVSVKLADPQFEGQTKSKLGSTNIRTLAETATRTHFDRWLEENPKSAQAIVDKARSAAKSRQAAKKAKELTRRKSKLDGGGMPDKLADCSTKKAEGTEIFVVEGASAGGTAKDARDPKTQAILPLRGKILNVERASMDKILKNTEVQALVSAIGGGVGRDFNLDDVRYERVVLTSDADSDGGHITVLLLTLFWRQMRPLIEDGRVWVAQPPLYSTVISGKKVYVSTDADREALVAANKNRNLTFARFKGLGEMDAKELRETVMDPTTRRAVQVTVDQAAIADELLDTLMGGNVEARRRYIETNAHDAAFIDI